ncbi:hypothetical protein ACVIGB_000050 [Bradyrhizobium sp. USDA 4341]
MEEQIAEAPGVRGRKPLPPAGESHPFMRWFGSIKADGCARRERSRENEDLLLEDEAMKQFAVGAEKGGVVVLGCIASDFAAISSVPWTSAALLRGHASKDWIALATKDARMKGAKSMNELPMRLWLPVAGIKMDVFGETRAATLRLREIQVSNGKAEVKSGGIPPLDLPLLMRGRW